MLCRCDGDVVARDVDAQLGALCVRAWVRVCVCVCVCVCMHVLACVCVFCAYDLSQIVQ